MCDIPTSYVYMHAVCSAFQYCHIHGVCSSLQYFRDFHISISMAQIIDQGTATPSLLPYPLHMQCIIVLPRLPYFHIHRICSAFFHFHAFHSSIYIVYVVHYCTSTPSILTNPLHMQYIMVLPRFPYFHIHRICSALQYFHAFHTFISIAYVVHSSTSTAFILPYSLHMQCIIVLPRLSYFHGHRICSAFFHFHVFHTFITIAYVVHYSTSTLSILPYSLHMQCIIVLSRLPYFHMHGVCNASQHCHAFHTSTVEFSCTKFCSGGIEWTSWAILVQNGHHGLYWYRMDIVGYIGIEWTSWAISVQNGHHGLYWHRMDIVGYIGIEWTSWAILVQNGHRGLYWPIIDIVGYIGRLFRLLILKYK